MKKYLILMSLFLIVHSIVYSQVPDQLNYQAAIRNNDGDLIVNQSVKVRVSIINEAMDGNELYTEYHSITTNSFGLVNLIIGNGTAESGSFAEINWGEKKKFLGISIDVGTGYVPMGTVQLLAVPYALYANDVANKDDADSDATNEIQNISLTGTDLSISNSNTIDVSSLIDDADNDPINELQNLVLNVDTLEISNGNKITLPYDSSLWVVSGNNLSYSTGNVGIGSINPESNFEVKSNTVGTDALFQVINANNDTVFAVYPDGVKVFVDPAAKGKVGGFAVSGRSPSKAGEEVEYMRVTMDSTRIYVNETTKGKVGGFAVSGRSPGKGDQQMFVTTMDSTRIFTQNAEGGFGVRDNSTGSSKSYLQLTPVNYFIGHESGVNITNGSFNSFMGYKSGTFTTTGDNNVFLGYQTGYNNTEGFNDVFIGYNAGFSNIDGYRNVFIGYESGYNNTSGFLNTFIGNVAGTNNNSGAANTIIGNYAGYSNLGGDENVFVGQSAGFGNESGSNNIYIGRASGYNNAGGSLNTYLGHFSGYTDNSSTFNVFIGAYSGYGVENGTSNVFIGKYAGYNETSVSDKLIISNSQTKNLIEGDFANDKVTIRDVLKLTPRSTAPSDPVEGEIYVDSTTHHIYCYLNGSWIQLD